MGTFQDYKDRVSIIQVALELGYKYDREKGRTQPHFVLTNSLGEETDSIYIKNPQNSSIQGYWRRGAAARNNTGDLISFVKENLSLFPETSLARNETDAINRVLTRMSGMTLNDKEALNKFAEANRGWTSKPFNIKRYERTFLDEQNMETAMRFLAPRNISEKTAILFRNSMELIKDNEGKISFRNLGFPYRIPGNNEIVGYEIRGFKGFKSKAEGTDSKKGCWMAYVGEQVYAGAISEIHMAESALDIMAYAQINKETLRLDNCVFVSFGGSLSAEQVKGVIDLFPMARPVLHFDNDLNGHIYDCKVAAISQGIDLKFMTDRTRENILVNVGEKSISIPMDDFKFSTFKDKSGIKTDIKVQKAPKPYKDWNDVLLVKEGNREGEKREIEERIRNRRRG